MNARKILTSLALPLLMSAGAYAQDFPNKTVTIQVPWPAGGSVDVAVRALATRELSAANAIRVTFRETFVGLLNGVGFGLITGAIAATWFQDWNIGAVISLERAVALARDGMPFRRAHGLVGSLVAEAQKEVATGRHADVGLSLGFKAGQTIPREVHKVRCNFFFRRLARL